MTGRCESEPVLGTVFIYHRGGAGVVEAIARSRTAWSMHGRRKAVLLGTVFIYFEVVRGLAKATARSRTAWSMHGRRKAVFTVTRGGRGAGRAGNASQSKRQAIQRGLEHETRVPGVA